jgi:hypothetical protein
VAAGQKGSWVARDERRKGEVGAMLWRVFLRKVKHSSREVAAQGEGKAEMVGEEKAMSGGLKGWSALGGADSPFW